MSQPPIRRTPLRFILHPSSFILLFLLLPAACTYQHRPARTRQDLLELRAEDRRKNTDDLRTIFARLLDRTHAQYQDYAAGRRPAPPTLDILIISGGGDWGAFGAGFLKGWASVPKSDPMAMPDFAAVTGVSTGALIAPFAFVGTDASIDRVVHLYRNPKKDWVVQRGVLYFLPNHISFAEVPGLERELRTNVDPPFVHQIASAGADGRLLAVNTSNVDDGSPRVFDLVDEARRADATGDLRRIHNVMLASAGIPGAFPFRVIDNQMYVDGGITGNIIYGGRLSEDDTLPALWQANFPEFPIPRIRYWVIFNNQIQPPPQVTEPNWPAVVTRSLEMSTRAATKTALRHLHATAEISRLKRHADIQVYTVSIPDDWTPPVPGVFQKETMNNLADLGQYLGAHPGAWNPNPPPP